MYLQDPVGDPCIADKKIFTLCNDTDNGVGSSNNNNNDNNNN
jgi:hypothetical protein